MKSAKVFREMPVWASSSLRTTQCGVAYNRPPVRIWADSPSWKASISAGIEILETSEKRFLAKRPPLDYLNFTYLPCLSMYIADVRAVSAP